MFLLVIVVLAVFAATRGGWIRRVGAFVVWFYAGCYLSAAEIGELTTSTSPLTGAKWELVLVLGSIGLAIAAAVLLAGLWALAAPSGQGHRALSRRKAIRQTGDLPASHAA